MLTNDMLVKEKIANGGQQRLYKLPNGFGLSLVNAVILHSYRFAWEAAVVTKMQDDGKFTKLTYDTPLTEDTEVFFTDEEANAFIEKAKQWALETLND